MLEGWWHVLVSVEFLLRKLVYFNTFAHTILYKFCSKFYAWLWFLSLVYSFVFGFYQEVLLILHNIKYFLVKGYIDGFYALVLNDSVHYYATSFCIDNCFGTEFLLYCVYIFDPTLKVIVKGFSTFIINGTLYTTCYWRETLTVVTISCFTQIPFRLRLIVKHSNGQ